LAVTASNTETLRTDPPYFSCLLKHFDAFFNKNPEKQVKKVEPKLLDRIKNVTRLRWINSTYRSLETYNEPETVSGSRFWS